MLERARELTRDERLENVSYELGDAQVHHRLLPQSCGSTADSGVAGRRACPVRAYLFRFFFSFTV
jgi:hypothetical protein